jgi:hypothetical protein
VRWKTTSLIGGPCTASNGFSLAVLTHEGLIYYVRPHCSARASHPRQFLVDQTTLIFIILFGTAGQPETRPVCFCKRVWSFCFPRRCVAPDGRGAEPAGASHALRATHRGCVLSLALRSCYNDQVVDCSILHVCGTKSLVLEAQTFLWITLCSIALPLASGGKGNGLANDAP